MTAHDLPRDLARRSAGNRSYPAHALAGYERPPDPPEPHIAFDHHDVLVSPAYLAGTTDDTFGAFTAPLAEHGWTCADDGADVTLFTSPCLRVQVGWLPEAAPDECIQIAARWHPLAEAQWHIGLDSGTPTEFVTALTITLADTLADEPDTLFENRSMVSQLPTPPGWRTTGPTAALSPDALAHYAAPDFRETVLPTAATPGWSFAAGEPTGRERWTAHFGATVPHVLVKAFHRAVTDPAPLTRDHRDITPWVRPYLATWPAPVPAASARGVPASLTATLPTTPRPAATAGARATGRSTR